MGLPFATVATAAGLFAGTNIDDMVVLAVLNASSRADGRPRRWQIWAGQYAGIAALTVISLAAALGLTLVPEGWVWLLGWIPIALGVRKLVIVIRARNSGERVSPTVATGLTGVMGVTIANGGDNIAAYTPVFRTISTADTFLTVAVFTVLVAVWCLAGTWLVSHHRVTRLIQRWGHWIVPAVFIGIGLYVFHKAGVLGL
jgi:cadmium resistance protein CadD (predicted permease)